jgi:hypothetical protein
MGVAALRTCTCPPLLSLDLSFVNGKNLLLLLVLIFLHLVSSHGVVVTALARGESGSIHGGVKKIVSCK